MATITPSEFAEQVHADPKTVRKFLRSLTPKEQQPGRGHRWELPGGKRDVNRLNKQWTEWSAAHTRVQREKTA